MAQPVAQRLVASIGAVLPVGQAVGRQIGLHLRPGHGQHGPDDPVTPGCDAREALKPRAPDQVQKHRLHLVVGVVGRGDAAGLGQEKIIPHPAGRFLHALPCLPGPGGHVAPAGRQFDAPGRTQPADKGLVLVGFGAPQAVVIVGGGHLDSKLLPQGQEAVEQGHGIRAAGQGADHPAARLRQMLPAAPIENLIPHCASTPGPRRW